MINYRSNFDTIQVTAPVGGVVGGTPVVIGSLFGIPASTVAAGQPVTLVTAGLFTLAKAGTLALTAGDRVYWNASTGVTKTESDTPIGFAASDAATTATSCSILVFPVAEVASATVGEVAADDVMIPAISNPWGGMAPVDVQTAIYNLWSGMYNHENSATIKHPASRISFEDNSGGMLGATVQDALDAYGPLIFGFFNGMYPIEFVGGATAGLLSITTKKADVTPAEGHVIVNIIGRVTADGSMIATPEIDTVFAAELEDDTGTVKIRQLSESDLSANTYVATVVPMPSLSGGGE